MPTKWRRDWVEPTGDCEHPELLAWGQEAS
jgi:hypothetical protein